MKHLKLAICINEKFGPMIRLVVFHQHKIMNTLKQIYKEFIVSAKKAPDGFIFKMNAMQLREIITLSEQEGMDKLFQAIDREYKSFNISEAIGRILQKEKEHA